MPHHASGLAPPWTPAPRFEYSLAGQRRLRHLRRARQGRGPRGVSTDGLIVVAVLVVLGPAIVGYLVWLFAIRPRRYEERQRERAEVVARGLGLQVAEPGRAQGMRAGCTVEVALEVGLPLQPYQSVSTTHCLALVEPRFHVSFAVVSPAVRSVGGWSERWAEDVGIAAPTPEARALAAAVAPVVQAAARSRPRDVLRIELDAYAARVVLRGIVLDPEPLARALDVAIEVARRARVTSLAELGPSPGS
jgi:hypothetical protein